MNRRTLLKMTGSSVLLSGLAGCTQSVDQSATQADRGGERNGSSNDGSTGNHPTNNSHASAEDHANGSTGTHDHNEGVTGPVSRADVAMITNDDGYHFDPHVVWVQKGGTVTWTLESGSHTTTAYHPQSSKSLRIPKAAAGWDSGMLVEEGATFEQTFEVEGVYDYFCIPHEYRGMIGSLIVGRPDTHKQPGLTPPQESLPQEAQVKIETLNAQVEEALNDSQ
jgi:plastocyanin